MKTEDLISKLQNDLSLSRMEVLLLLANTLADSMLATHSATLAKAFEMQSNRLAFRKLRSVLDTLQKLNFLRFHN